MNFNRIYTYFILLISINCFAQVNTLYSTDFNTNAAGWTFSNVNANDWKWYADQGENSTGGLRYKFPELNAFVASPSVNLIANKTYTVIFKARVIKGTNARTICVGYNNIASRTGVNIISKVNLPTNGYTQLPFESYNNTFTATATGSFKIILWSETGGYVFTYLDDFTVEEAKAPTIYISSPINNAIFTEGNTVNIETNPADTDGTIKNVKFWLNGLPQQDKLAAPFNLSLAGLYPGDYKVVVQTTDNRDLTSEKDSISFRINFSDGTFGKYIHWDFNNNNLDYWTLKNGNWRPRSGFNNTSALECFSAYAGNFAASTAVNLKTGNAYSLTFRKSNANLGGVPVQIRLNTKPELGGTLLQSYVFPTNASFDSLYTVNFNVPTNGDYYLIFNYAGVRNFIQLRFDEIRIRGNLNRGAFVTLEKPDGTAKIAKGAHLFMKASGIDTDGYVSKMRFFANDSLITVVNAEPFEFEWQDLPEGNFNIIAEAEDNDGGKSRSLIKPIVTENTLIATSTFVGNKVGNNEVRSAIIQKSGAIVLAINADSIALESSKIIDLSGGASGASYIVKASADGKEFLQAIKIGARVSDMSSDSLDNIYVAASLGGLMKINPAVTQILWTKNFAKTVHRVDASKAGNTAIMLAQETDIDDLTLQSGVQVLVHNAAGTELSSSGGATQYNSDVAIDDASDTYVIVGFKNYYTYSFPGDTRYLPVYVPVVVGRSFSGVQKYRAYDWSSDSSSVNWLNKAENNMADVKAVRCSMGKDGKLYVMYHLYGGNHILRYQPFSNITPATIVGGDNYFNMSNTGTETKIAFARYEIGTGAFILGQQLTNRLEVAPYAGNSIFGNKGNIQADEEGRVYITDRAASGLPFTVDHQPGAYTGGAYLAIISPNFSVREKIIRLTNGEGRALAVRNKNHYVFGGITSNDLFTVDNQQSQISGQNAWFAVQAIDNPCPKEIIIPFNIKLKKYNSSGYIRSTDILTESNSYAAKNYIELSPGFSVGSGLVFEAKIKGCAW